MLFKTLSITTAARTAATTAALTLFAAQAFAQTNTASDVAAPIDTQVDQTANISQAPSDDEALKAFMETYSNDNGQNSLATDATSTEDMKEVCDQLSKVDAGLICEITYPDATDNKQAWCSCTQR